MIAAYSRTPIPLQFMASTCIAQNAWVPRLRTSVLTRKRRRWRLFSPVPPLLTALLAAQFRLICHKLACSFLASKMLEPARECLLVKSKLTAIFGLRNATALPRLDVKRPPLASGLVLEMFLDPPEILHSSREPEMEREHTLGKSCKVRTLTARRKRPNFAHRSGIDMSVRPPNPRQEFVETVDRMSVGHPLQDVAQIGIGFDAVEFAGLCRPPNYAESSLVNTFLGL